MDGSSLPYAVLAKMLLEDDGLRSDMVPIAPDEITEDGGDSWMVTLRVTCVHDEWNFGYLIPPADSCNDRLPERTARKIGGRVPRSDL